MKQEIYVSVDIEADGPIPGPHSMLSLGAAAFTDQAELVATFSSNLECLPSAKGHPDTLDWWKTQSEAWYDAKKQGELFCKMLADSRNNRQLRGESS